MYFGWNKMENHRKCGAHTSFYDWNADLDIMQVNGIINIMKTIYLRNINENNGENSNLVNWYIRYGTI